MREQDFPKEARGFLLESEVYQRNRLVARRKDLLFWYEAL
jgi:hypothetical protein